MAGFRAGLGEGVSLSGLYKNAPRITPGEAASVFKNPASKDSAELKRHAEKPGKPTLTSHAEQAELRQKESSSASAPVTYANCIRMESIGKNLLLEFSATRKLVVLPELHQHFIPQARVAVGRDAARQLMEQLAASLNYTVVPKNFLKPSQSRPSFTETCRQLLEKIPLFARKFPRFTSFIGPGKNDDGGKPTVASHLQPGSILDEDPLDSLFAPKLYPALARPQAVKIPVKDSALPKGQMTVPATVAVDELEGTTLRESNASLRISQSSESAQAGETAEKAKTENITEASPVKNALVSVRGSSLPARREKQVPPDELLTETGKVIAQDNVKTNGLINQLVDGYFS